MLYSPTIRYVLKKSVWISYFQVSLISANLGLLWKLGQQLSNTAPLWTKYFNETGTVSINVVVELKPEILPHNPVELHVDLKIHKDKSKMFYFQLKLQKKLTFSLKWI